MRDLSRRNFVVVVEKASSRVVAIVQGIDERRLTDAQLDEADTVMLQKCEELQQRFPDSTHEVILARALGMDDLKVGLSELSGWEQASPEHM